MNNFLGKDYLLSSPQAAAIYQKIATLPIVDMHNHANVEELAQNKNYDNLWQLFAATDHYVWEVLRKCNVPEEFITGKRSPEEKFLKMAEVFPQLAGNPVYEWVHLDLKRYLNIDELLNSANAMKIWTEGNRILQQPSMRPLEILKRLNVEVMCSTDDPIDRLEHHAQVNREVNRTLVRPTWRPDRVMKITAPTWNEYINLIAKRFDRKINSLRDLIDAMDESHEYFAAHGCVASDHGLEIALSSYGDIQMAEAAFAKARRLETLTADEAKNFSSYVLGELLEMNAKRNFVTQLHVGAVRDVRKYLFDHLGPDSGGDISNMFQNHLPELIQLLNRFDGRLQIVLYHMDPMHASSFATLSRAFGGSVHLGSAWWLCDNPIGMKRQLEYIGSVDVLSNFAGMVSDSRKLLSYGSRFEMFRRILSDVLGNMAAHGQAPLEVMKDLAANMAYNGPKKLFNL